MELQADWSARCRENRHSDSRFQKCIMDCFGGIEGNAGAVSTARIFCGPLHKSGTRVSVSLHSVVNVARRSEPLGWRASGNHLLWFHCGGFVKARALPSRPDTKHQTSDFPAVCRITAFQNGSKLCCQPHSRKARGVSIRIGRCKQKNCKSFPWAGWASSA